MADHGANAVSLNDIARRAGVHATSIQRRWGSREKLMLDAMLTHSRELLPIPDTGTLREDLIAFARSITAYLTTPLGAALARMMAVTDDDPTLSASRAQFWHARYDTARVIIDRGLHRHELAADTDPALALELLVAPLHFRSLLTRQPIDDGQIERMVEVILRGIAGYSSHRAPAPR